MPSSYYIHIREREDIFCGRVPCYASQEKQFVLLIQLKEMQLDGVHTFDLVSPDTGPVLIAELDAAICAQANRQ